MVRKIVFFVVVVIVFAGCSFLLSSPFPSMASWADSGTKIAGSISDLASPPYEGMDIRIRCVGNAGDADTVYVIFAIFLWADGNNLLRLVVMDKDLNEKAVFSEEDFFKQPGEMLDNILWDGSYLWWGTYKIDVERESVESSMSGGFDNAKYGLYNGTDYYLLRYNSNTLEYYNVSSFPTPPTPPPTTKLYFSATSSPPSINNWISAWEGEKYFSILMDASDNAFYLLSVPYGSIGALSEPLMDNYPNARFSREDGYDLWGSGAVAVGGDSIIVVKREEDVNYVEHYDLSGNKRSVDEWPFSDDYPIALSRDGNSLYIFDKRSGYLYKGAVWW